MVVSAPPVSRFAFDSSDSAVRALGSCHGRAAKSGSHFYPWEMGRTQLSVRPDPPQEWAVWRRVSGHGYRPHAKGDRGQFLGAEPYATRQ